jgi:hypothetical protein
MKRRIAWIVAVALSLSFAVVAYAQDRAWSEGVVTNVTAVKIADGQFENYMDYLSKNWKPVMEEAKKAGYVTEYHVYSAQAHNPQEADLYLVVSYPNMAMLDGMDKKMEPIQAKITKMNFREADTASGKRVVMRNLLGEELLREITLH